MKHSSKHIFAYFLALEDSSIKTKSEKWGLSSGYRIVLLGEGEKRENNQNW